VRDGDAQGDQPCETEWDKLVRSIFGDHFVPDLRGIFFFDVVTSYRRLMVVTLLWG
jgi:hypothetical protein